MNNYKNILLNRLHTTINHKNEIENDCIKFLSYDITIEPKIVQIEKKKSILCTVYFYVKAPLFDNVFFESSSSIASDEYKAIELSSDNFVYCALQGILDFLSGMHHHDIETSMLGNKKIFTVCESPILGLGNIDNNISDKEDFYNDYIGFDEKNGYASFLWNCIYKEVPFILPNNRVSFIKTYAAKMPNDDIIVECTINNIQNKILENCVQNEIIKWDNNGEFFSIKQFFFILQSDTTYIKYPYTKEEIEYFVMEYVLEFEKCDFDYDEFIKNIKNVISDNNIREEIINFIPEICAEYAFKDVVFNDRVDVNIGNNHYNILKTQFTSYKYIEDALIDGFSNKIFKKESFNELVHISNSYNIIYEAMQNDNNIKMNDIFVSVVFNFSDKYKFV
ncbi:DUF6348 family protein [Brachyspira hyodysenteriae]|uniref:DUF6348 family protein n=1 Tax=Brachyspira hyodysenteriae TaxID=159 RepID=UPI0022CD3F4B|nr:DUF6348 family protein [Brachyspira hyodysenteriae]MCZ9840202.1 DUF6348 family protein [Brachyspira hyodysenteriae]MCZ9848590.1 DUF6348 family protein [Brachyspira hyodysenteriae]MCZ9871951.1 DUF6348 family protein [Brachyspira hyodysenteriae]MCZ9875655.1 DUF6348 family protein [Brachyspira hyodysenteriae]MCZ9893081.1 DUF6348 family protein [Brachyspira hyodysenteriae]